MLVAIDIGGTFTDLMAFDGATGRLAQAKSLTTPNQLVEGIIDCLRMSGVDLAEIGELIHGSTIVYAYMQAVGMVNDHLTSCFRRAQLRFFG